MTRAVVAALAVAVQAAEPSASDRGFEEPRPESEVRTSASDEPPAAHVPPPSAAPPSAAPAEHEDLMPRPQPRPWQRDPAAGALAGVGSLAAALGVGLIVGAHQVQRDAPNVADEGEFGDRLATAKRMNVAGWSTLAVGCTLLVSAALRWGFLAREQRARKGSRTRR